MLVVVVAAWLNFPTKCNILNLRQIHMFHSNSNKIKRCKRRRKEKSKHFEIRRCFGLNFEEVPFIDMPLDLFYYVNLQQMCALESILIFHFYLICVHSTVLTCKKNEKQMTGNVMRAMNINTHTHTH